MPKYEVDIPHSLPAEEVRARLSKATAKLESSYGATCSWNGERTLVVTRKGLDATVTIEDARVHVDMALGFLLTPVASAIKAGLTRELGALLSSGSAAPA